MGKIEHSVRGSGAAVLNNEIYTSSLHGDLGNHNNYVFVNKLSNYNYTENVIVTLIGASLSEPHTRESNV